VFNKIQQRKRNKKKQKQNKMISILITPEIRKEIIISIGSFDTMIKREMQISVDLRDHKKIVKYSKEIMRLQRALIYNFI